MKILALIGSLRKKNTVAAVERIEKYHREIDNCEYEYLFLKDLDLDLCRGCFLCISKGEHFCPLKDDRDMLCQKMEAADAVILASPNYAANVPWLMKNCLDRFAYLSHRPAFFNTRFMLFVTSGNYKGVKETLKALSMLVSGGKILCRTSLYTASGLKPELIRKQEEKLRKNAVKFAQSLKKNRKIKPPFSFLIWFSAFKSMSLKGRENYPADYDYYKDREYFTDAGLNQFQRISISFFTWFFGRML